MAIRTFRPGLFSALLACMSLASLAPLLVLEGSRFEGINGEVADHHDAELLLAASSMARETLSVVEGHRRATETLALSVSLQHQPLEQLQRQLHSLRNSYGGFSYLVLMNPDGVALVAEPPAGADGRPGAGTNYADRPYVQEVQRTRAFALGGVMLGKRSGVPNAHFGVPVLDEHGALEGMLGVALELDMLGRVAAQVESTTELIRVVLLDEQGKVIWHPDPALRRSMSNLASTEIYAQRAPAPAATTGLNEAGQRVRALAVPVALRNANWRAVAVLPMEHIDEEVRRTRTRIVALTLAAFAASLLLSFVFARWLANPIGQLVEVLQSIGESPVGHRPRERLVETTEVAALQGAVAGLQVRLSTQRDMRRAKEQAEESSRAKSSFLANMSHEIRTPINAIMGMTHLVLKTVLSTQQRGYLNQIGTSSRHLLGVVNDILDYSRIEAGKLSLECIRFSLEKVLRDAVAQVEQKAVAKGLALSVSIDPDVPDALMGDPLRVTQILVNFLSNAVKFTTRGTVVLRAKAAKQDADSVALELRVTDTGIGLTEQQQTLLFQSFEQADDSTTRRFGGSGLGLAICRQLATLKGGEVGVESQFGQGSTFWFRASFARALELGPAPLHSAPAVDLSALRGARILLVEDNELNQEIAVALLSDADVEVRVARDGQEALRTLEAEAFDVVLMDLQMPVMDGLEATREIRRRAPLAGLPVIAMTASAMHSERAACEEVGMNDHITKPIEPDVLFGVLSRWVRARGGTPPPPAGQRPHAARAPGSRRARHGRCAAAAARQHGPLRLAPAPVRGGAARAPRRARGPRGR